MDVSVRELRAHLSECLRRVTHDEELVITRRGQPIARLVPTVDEARSGTVTVREVERRLMNIPGLRPGRGGKVVGLSPPLPIAPGSSNLSDIVLSDRD